MNLVELNHALRKLRLSGMADVLETRLHQAQTTAHVSIGPVLRHEMAMARENSSTATTASAASSARSSSG